MKEFINYDYYYENMLNRIKSELYNIVNEIYKDDFCKPVFDITMRFINQKEEYEILLTCKHNSEEETKVIYSTLDENKCNLKNIIKTMYDKSLL